MRKEIQDKLDYFCKRYAEVERLISDPDVLKDQNRYRELMQEYSHLQQVTEKRKLFLEKQDELTGAKQMLESETDTEMAEMARMEVEGLEEELEKLEKEIKGLLIPPDPLDQKDIIVEIRAGTGGDEAALFASDLFRMYSRYAESRNWKVEIMDANQIELGGFKEVVFSISGKNVYENMRYESGVHRVQRVPVTESGGRIHTSAITVAVLPEAEETEIDINPNELRIDVFRSSGPGGQSVNTTDSAVRITHEPSGLVVTCQDEKSQHKNKAKALRVLRARLYEMEAGKKQAERASERKNQIGSGDRSERIRTYNYPQNRVSDHRINLTLYKLDQIIEGDLEEVIEALKLSARDSLIEESL